MTLPLPPVFEYSNMPPPISMGDNPMYMAANKVPTGSQASSSQNTLSRQFKNPLYDYDEDEGMLPHPHCYCSYTLPLSLAGDATVLTNPSTKS